MLRFPFLYAILINASLKKGQKLLVKWTKLNQETESFWSRLFEFLRSQITKIRCEAHSMLVTEELRTTILPDSLRGLFLLRLSCHHINFYRKYRLFFLNWRNSVEMLQFSGWPAMLEHWTAFQWNSVRK